MHANLHPPFDLCMHLLEFACTYRKLHAQMYIQNQIRSAPFEICKQAIFKSCRFGSNRKVYALFQCCTYNVEQFGKIQLQSPKFRAF